MVRALGLEWLPASLLAALLLGAVGCAAVFDRAGGSDLSEEDLADPALATVQLKGVVVGLVGSGILVQNHSPEGLKSVVIVLNENGQNGGYRFRASDLGPNSTHTFLTQVFRNESGDALNTEQTQITSFALYADSPRGRGFWRGAY